MFRRIRVNIRRSVGIYRSFSSGETPNIKRYFLAVVGAVGTAAVAFGTAFVSNYPTLKEIKKDVVDNLPLVLKTVKLEKISTNVYVERKELLHCFEQFLKLTPTGRYYIVYGARGAGKSTIVHNAFADIGGVVKVNITGYLSKDQIAQKIAEKILQRTLEPNSVNDENLIESLQKCESTPTIIFDVERAASEEQQAGLNVVRSFAKALAERCRCIIILSEANTVLQFGKDDAREGFIFVDEMTDEEAILLFTKLNIPLSEEKRRYFFDNVGKRPALIGSLLNELQRGVSVEQFVEQTLQSAYRNLKSFPHKEILQALKEHPDGVDPDVFGDKMHGNVRLGIPSDVAPAMKATNAIIYRMDCVPTRYELMSVAHRKMLEKYEPKV